MITKLQTYFRRLWAEQDGFVLSSELVLGGSLLLGGAVVALTQVRDTLTGEFADVAQAIGNLDQSYSISGIRGHSAWTAGSAFSDRADVGDGEFPAGQPHVGAPGNRFVPQGRPTVCADVFPSAPPAFAPHAHPPGAPPHVAPPHVAQPQAAPQPKQAPKPVPPTMKQPPAPSKQPAPDPNAGAAVAPRPGPCGHPQGHMMVGGTAVTGCLTAGCVGCVTNYGMHPGGYGYQGNTNYSFPAMMRNPYGYQHWGAHYGHTSAVIDFQPAMPGASGVPGWGPVTGHVPCVQAPCAHGHGCVSCVPTCGTIPNWGPREGSLPQQRITFTPAPQPGEQAAPGRGGDVLKLAPATDADLRALKGRDNIRVLHVHAGQVTDEGLEFVATLKNLEVLHLVGTRISDEGLEELARLSNLRELHIHGGKLSPNGLKHLRRLERLHVLDIRDAGIPREAVSRFLDERPRKRSND